MDNLIDRAELYKHIAELEELARNRVCDTPTNSPAYMRYVAQLNERTYLKHEIADALTIDPVHAAGACYCRECTCWNRHDDILPDGRFPDWGYCSKMLDSDSEIEITTLENDFCSYGQRREDTK